MKAPKTYTIRRFKLSYVMEPDHEITKERRRIRHRDDVKEFLSRYLKDVPLESLIVIALDQANHVIGFCETEGVVNQAHVYVSNVFRFLLSTNACSFIIAHNHPGGTVSASESDWVLTKRLWQTAGMLEIPLLDHVIVGDEMISMKDSNRWLSFDLPK